MTSFTDELREIAMQSSCVDVVVHGLRQHDTHGLACVLTALSDLAQYPECREVLAQEKALLLIVPLIVHEDAHLRLCAGKLLAAICNCDPSIQELGLWQLDVLSRCDTVPLVFACTRIFFELVQDRM